MKFVIFCTFMEDQFRITQESAAVVLPIIEP